MERRPNLATIILAMASGMIGGAVISHLSVVKPVMAQTAPGVSKVLRAERFELVDSSGKVYATLEVLHTGIPRLALGSTPEKAIALLPTALVLKDNDSAALLGALPDGERGLMFTSQDGIGIFGGPATGIDLHHKDGMRASLRFSPEEHVPLMAFYRKGSEVRAVLGLLSNGAASLSLADRDGKMIWTAP